MWTRVGAALIIGSAACTVPAIPAAAATTSPTTVTCGGSTGPFRCSLAHQTCSRTGGALGLGYEVFVARQSELGQSGTTRFEQRAQLQYDDNGVWLADGPVVIAKSSAFPDNQDGYYFRYRWQADYGDNETGRAVRVCWQGLWLSATGATIARTAVLTEDCPAG
jgi:hypothetical protein